MNTKELWMGAERARGGRKEKLVLSPQKKSLHRRGGIVKDCVASGDRVARLFGVFFFGAEDRARVCVALSAGCALFWG